MTEHYLVTAAREFQKDETRRERRHQALRMPDILAESHLRASLSAIESTSTAAGVHDPRLRSQRGLVAVGIFGYEDTLDEQAATVITDILHAVASLGFSPQAVLDQAAAYYAEER